MKPRISVFRTYLLLLVLSGLLIQQHLLQAEPSQPDTALASYILESWQNHPDLQSMRAMVSAESSRTVMSGAWMNPELRGGLMNAPTDFNLQREPMTMIQIGLMQRIPFPGKLSSATEAGQARTQAAEVKVTDAEFQMADMVIMAYYDLAAAVEVRRALEHGLDLTHELTESAAALLSAGGGSQSDVLRARLETEQWNQRLVTNHSDIERKRAALAYAIGRADASTIPDPALPDSVPATPDLTTALASDTLEATPEVREARLRADAANAEVRHAKLGYYPDIGLMAAYSIRQDMKSTSTDPQTGITSTTTMPRDNMVSLEMSIPIPLFYRGNQGARIAEMRAMRRDEEQKAENTKLAKEHELRDLHAVLTEKIDNYGITATSVMPQAEDTWRATMLDYRAARLPLTTLAEARMKVVMAEIDKAMLRAGAWATYYRWRAALGQSLFDTGEN